MHRTMEKRKVSLHDYRKEALLEIQWYLGISCALRFAENKFIKIITIFIGSISLAKNPSLWYLTEYTFVYV